jgi:hypothetical protein
MSLHWLPVVVALVTGLLTGTGLSGRGPDGARVAAKLADRAVQDGLGHRCLPFGVDASTVFDRASLAYARSVEQGGSRSPAADEARVCIELAIGAGADVNRPRMVGRRHRSALGDAIWLHDERLLELFKVNLERFDVELFEHGPAGERNPSGSTLTGAVERGYADLVKFLLDRGVAVDPRSFTRAFEQWQPHVDMSAAGPVDRSAVLEMLLPRVNSQLARDEVDGVVPRYESRWDYDAPWEWSPDVARPSNVAAHTRVLAALQRQGEYARQLGRIEFRLEHLAHSVDPNAAKLASELLAGHAAGRW